MVTKLKQLSKTHEKAEIFRLLSDPSRIKILEALSSDKEFCVTDISKKTDVTLSATSHQLRKLELMGIVKKCRYGQNICYCLNRKNNLTKKIIRILKLIN